jgi:hypothetical protein
MLQERLADLQRIETNEQEFALRAKQSLGVDVNLDQALVNPRLDVSAFFRRVPIHMCPKLLAKATFNFSPNFF